MRLLLVEDDVKLAAGLAQDLIDRGHAVRIARDGRDALFLIGDEKFDAVILDRMLPLIDGVEVLKRMRNAQVTMPIIMMTALGELRDKVEGLDAGADDYVVKPVAVEELEARLKALMRRPRDLREDGILRVGTIEVNLIKHVVKRSDTVIDLMPLEFSILAALMRNSDQVMTRKMLLEEVWGYDFEPSTNLVDAQIARLRTRLNFGDHEDAIMTVRGVGYSIREGA